MKHQRINIPKIDVSGVDNNAFPKTLLEEFYHAYNTYGFGYIVNHGIEKDLIDQLFQVSKTFHSCLLYTSPSPRDRQKSRMPSSA